MAFFVIITQENLTEFEIAAFAIIIAASAVTSSGYSNASKNVIRLEFVRSIFVLALVFLTPLWNFELTAVQILWIHAMLNVMLIPLLLNYGLGANKMPHRQESRSDC
ncbi:MAG: hypothetical protein CMK28_00040 [Porticoccaceae bacterium]|nr:hypothetical protein [Porticoccaceae bacterium]